ncbi:MAG: fimbrillin family protein [Prevotella sp.]|nr:fimbrillin family protein [Prevotella sp.]
MKERFSVRLALVMAALAMTVSCSQETDLADARKEPIAFFTEQIYDGFQDISTRSLSNSQANSGLRTIMRSKDGKTISLKVTKAPMPERHLTATRGTIVRTSADVEEIGVSASIYGKKESYSNYACGNFFYNEPFVPGVGREWYWPTNDYRLSFYAYHPYGNSAFTMVADATVKGIPTYSYVVPEDVRHHADVMTAHVLDQTGGMSGAVSLSFRHHCTALKFVLTNSGDEPMEVRSVTIKGVKNSGTLSNGTWTVASSVSDYVLECDTIIEGGQTVNLSDGDGYMFMIPQTLPSGVKIELQTAKNTFEASITGTWTAGQMEVFTMDANDAVNYLRFTAIEDGTFTLTIPASVNTSYLTSVSYSLDDGDTWVTTENSSSAVTITTPTVTAGNSVVWKGDGKQYSSGTSASTASKFSSTGRYNVSGSIMSLLYGNGVNKTVLPGNYTFIYLFNNNTKLVDASELLLPATTLRERCYAYMFNGCTSLTTAPELPAMTLANVCYLGMFYGCTSLTTAPDLPATMIAGSCYSNMFNGCTSLTTAPDLPATTLQNQCYEYMFASTAITTAPELPATTMRPYCYQYMFYRCKSLTTAPELPATTVDINSYKYMFNGCTSLTTAPELPATTLQQYCYQNMFSSCTSLTTAPELPATTLQQSCYYSMFSSCTALTAAPELPATTLAQACYAYMFAYCRSLTTAPELPATTLAPQCYQMMFNRCTKLNYVKAAFVDIPYTNSLNDWLTNVSKTGTFVKNAAATWTGYIPSGWTIETYTP